MTVAAHPRDLVPPLAPAKSFGKSVSLRLVVAVFGALVILDNILLLAFLGQPRPVVILIGVAVPILAAFSIYRAVPVGPRIGARTITICLAVALVLLILGGEGRLLYANEDWQIRDAVLRDMATHRWPFDYWLDGRSQMLRAPLGMYLVPAALGGASQFARDWIMAIHNMVFLGLLFAAGSARFETARARSIALVMFVMFSGFDIIGSIIVRLISGGANWDHLERWVGPMQLSSHITQIFWVPQHGFAGWACALAYLLWRRGLIPVSLFGALLPLMAIWSPFALFGSLPFAIFAAVRALATGQWSWRDLLSCICSVAIASPSLAYLNAGAGSLGSGFQFPDLALYGLAILLEVLPFLLPLISDRAPEADRATTRIVAACLFLIPFWHIGTNSDFQMRATIVPLAIMAISFAQWALRIEKPRGKLVLLLIIALGSVTGSAEIARVFRLMPSPLPLCSLQGAWTRQTGMVVPHAAYFAPRADLPTELAASPLERAGDHDPAQCWARRWQTPRTVS